HASFRQAGPVLPRSCLVAGVHGTGMGSLAASGEYREPVPAGRENARACVNAELVVTAGAAVVDQRRAGRAHPLTVVPADGDLQVQLPAPVVIGRRQHEVDVLVTRAWTGVKVHVEPVLDVRCQNALRG